MLQLHELQEKENKPNDDILLHESQDMTGYNLCAPDTLDFLQGIIFSFLLFLIPKMAASKRRLQSLWLHLSLDSILSNSCRKHHKFCSKNR